MSDSSTGETGYLGDFSGFQAQVAAWAEETFPEGTLFTNLDHLADKAEELRQTAEDRTLGEATSADVHRKIGSMGLLLLHLAAREGIDLYEVMVVKHGLDLCSEFGPTPGKTYWARRFPGDPQ